MQHERHTLTSSQTAGSKLAFVHSLPMPLTPLVGREREVAEVCTLLRRPTVRLLTLVGTGGVGKTRLGLAVAHEMPGDFTDGICFVALAPLSEHDRVIPAIAQVLGLWEAGDRSLAEQVQMYLRERHLLLLLDNFEHVIEAAPQLASLLTSCPYLSILVTSRAALRLSGEQEFPVSPLVVPDLKHLPADEALAQIAAVTLFLQRAQATFPGLRLTPTNARTLAEICVRLDGLPLAIELAAARIKLLPPQALLKRLSHRFEILTGGAQDAPVRQQTLRNMIQWSYDMLNREEQRLFRHLAVFNGGCTLEALSFMMQATGDLTHSASDQTREGIEGVASLLNKSLLLQTERESGEPRLVLLETIREFGLERLQEQGELQTARKIHAAYYLQFAEQAYEHLFGAQAMRWFELLEQEYENLRAVFRWALEEQGEQEEHRIEIAARLGLALWRFWITCGRVSEGCLTMERVSAACEALEVSVQVKALLAWGALIFHQGYFARDYHWVDQKARNLLLLCQQLGDRQGVAHTLFGLAGFAVRQQDYEQAEALAQESLAISRMLADPWRTATALVALGRLASIRQEHTRAQQLLEESLSLYRTLGYAGDTAWPLIYLARDAITRGEYAQARGKLEEALTFGRKAGNKWVLAHTLSLLGQDALEQGDLASAHSLLSECHQINLEAGNQRNIAHSLFLLATVQALQGDVAQAYILYQQGLILAQSLEHTRLIASCLLGLAVTVTAQGQPVRAGRLWGTAEQVMQDCLALLPRALRPVVEQAWISLSVQLGNDGLRKALTEGKSMEPAQILAAQEPPSVRTLPEATVSPTSSTVPSSTRKSPTYPEGLTAREVEVLRLVAQGLSDAQVAEQLVVSHRTVTTHLTSIYNKLGVNSRVAATRFAVEQQLV